MESDKLPKNVSMRRSLTSKDLLPVKIEEKGLNGIHKEAVVAPIKKKTQKFLNSFVLNYVNEIHRKRLFSGKYSLKLPFYFSSRIERSGTINRRN
jgi:hypothetical protein